jgi:hypothetical protein
VVFPFFCELLVDNLADKKAIKNFTTLINASTLTTTKKIKIKKGISSLKVMITQYSCEFLNKKKLPIINIDTVDNPLNIILGKIFIFKLYFKNSGNGQMIKKRATNLDVIGLRITTKIHNKIKGISNLLLLTIRK